jgi:iron complex outermembrane receptor protein
MNSGKTFILGAISTILLAAPAAATEANPALQPGSDSEAPASSEVPASAENDLTRATESGAPPPLIEEIVVRAPGKRAQLIQDVPASVSAFGAEQLQDYRIRGFEDTLRLVPNAFVEERGNSTVVISIRGNGTSGNSTDTGVGLYVDGIYDFVQGTQNNLLMYDIGQVEVLRGPQGGLYGRNAVGGALVVETARPTNELTARVSAEGGNFASRRVEAVLNVPLLDDKLLIRGAGLYFARDSFFYNTTLDRYERGVEQLSGRLWVRALPIEGLRIDAGIEGTKEDLPGQALTPASVGKERITTSNVLGYNDRERTRYVADILLERLEWFDVQSLTGFIQSKGTVFQDFDNNPVTDSETLQTLPAKQLTQELRVLSKQDDSPLTWLFGFNYFYDRASGGQDNVIDLGGGAILEQVVGIDGGIDTYAAFFEATYEFLDSLELTASLRYSHERKFADISSVADIGGAPFAPQTYGYVETDTYEKFNPGGSIAYHFTQDLMAYFRATTSYKSGGFNVRPVPDPSDISFNPEDAVNYEVGARVTLLDGALSLNPTVFQLQQKDLQVRREIVEAGTRYTFFANVGDGRTNGAELQMLLAPHPDVDISLSYGFLDAKFDKAPNTQFGDVTGNRIPFIPEHTINLGAEYRPLLPDFWKGAPAIYGFLRGDLYLTLGGYQNPQNTLAMQDRTLLNFQAGIDADFVRLRLFVNNVADQTYWVFVPPTADGVGVLNPPRTWGGAVEILFN